MGDIADAVNAFASEALQKQAFDALMRSAGVALGGSEAASPTGRPDSSASSYESRPAAPKSDARKAPGTGAKKTPKKTPSHVADLNLRPKDHPSFQDFVSTKKPSNQSEQNLLCVYYLTHELTRDKVTVDDIFTCYREMKATWRVPADLHNSLQKTASVDGYLKTSDMQNILLTSSGTNTVEHDLPRPAKATK